MKAKFWMLYADGQRPPAKMHSTLCSAEKEAERLATANPGADFYILEAVSLMTGTVTIKTEELEEVL